MCACTVSSQPTTPFVAQRRTVLAQYLLNRRQRASPRRAVLCLHSIFSTDDALRRPETCCACTASSQPTAPFVVQRRTVLAQHLLNRRRPSSSRDVLCLHSIFSTDDALRRPETYCACTASSQPTTPFVAQSRTVLAQHLLNRRHPSSRRDVLCLHSIFSTDDTLRRAETYCACTASSQPTTARFAAQSRAVLAQHLLNRRRPSSPRDVLCLHSIFSTDDALRRPETYCACTASSQPTTAPFVPQKHTVFTLHRGSISSTGHSALGRTETDHVFAPRHAASPRPTTAHFAASKSTVFAQHIFFESERALRRSETYCACTAYSHPATAPFVA